ncbi:MAG: beta-ketoacyl-ACP synthase II [Fimbriimonadaceae bacterium]|nr:beta-ketoacyl-ACP synthase II [Fimbriimonadaceae bacterium]
MSERRWRRVVVTGLGAVSPVGIGVSDYWSALTNGANGAGPITQLDVSAFTTRIGAEVKNFDPSDWVEGKDASRIDRVIAFAAAAAKQAVLDSGFPEGDDARINAGVLIGSGIGGLITLCEQYEKLIKDGPRRISPFLVPYMIPDMCSGFVSIQHGFRGPNSCVVTACATGANSIGEAAAMISRGDAIAMIAGGAEAPINPISMAGFCAARTMSTRNDDPLHASRPFDAERDGFLIGEGAGVLVLEELEHAQSRGAKIYAELIGYGQSGDAHHITSPSPDGNGAVRAMQMAIRNAGIANEDIDYINAHGTSTDLNDRTETLAIRTLFGTHADQLAVSSTKSQIGHTLGAAGALEAIACIKALESQIAPPTINYENPDPACDLDYVPNEARPMKIRNVLSNSFGFGGHNATLIFTSPRD